MKFKCFSYEDGKTTNTAYFDGYDFGDRILEGVSFKAEIIDGNLSVSFAWPKGNYEKGLNQRHWLEKAQKYAEKRDIFSDDPTLHGVDVALEKDGLQKFKIYEGANEDVFLIVEAESHREALEKMLKISHSDLGVITVHDAPWNRTGIKRFVMQNGWNLIVEGEGAE